MFASEFSRYPVRVNANGNTNMKLTAILAAIALALSAPVFAKGAKSTQKQTAPASAADTQERGATIGRGTRNTASTTRNKTPLL
jgi:uncharacterized protein HemX